MNIHATTPTSFETVPVEAITPASRNARRHTKAQIEQIAQSIKRFGFINPVLVDRDGKIVAGHGRFEAAKSLGRSTVPTLRIEHLSPAELRAYALADNQLAALAGWDDELLKLELGELAVELPDLDLTLTGFQTAELDRILLPTPDAESDETVEIPPVPERPVTRRGDIWLLDRHRILCGDARFSDSYAKLLGEQRAGMVITDPPYNVRIDGHARGLGKDQHADFAMASGEMTEEEFTAFLQTVCGHMASFSRPGALHYICMDWRHMFETLQAGRSTYDRLVNLCVWAKGAGGMGSFYRSEHELVFVWRTKGAGHVNNVQLGRFGRNRTNVWRYAGANGFGAERDEMLRLHPTVKPTTMIADAIRDGSKRNEIILDPFLGSGTTILAAEQTGRIGVGIEFEPKYTDVVVQRFEELTGCKTRHGLSGLTFAEEAELRHKTYDSASAVGDSDSKSEC